MTVNTLDSREQGRTSRTVAEWLWPFLPMAVSAFCISSLLYYHSNYETFAVRTPLQVAVAWLYRSIGLAPALMFFLVAVFWSAIWLHAGRLERPLARLGRLAAMALMLGVFINLGSEDVVAVPHQGEWGAWLAARLVAAFGYVVSLLLVWPVTFASIMLATDFLFHDQFDRLRGSRLSSDEGVEAAVTDHLRELAKMGDLPVAPMAAGVASPPRAETVPAAAVADAEPTAEDWAAATDVSAEHEVVIEPPPRRSYLDRRRERERRWSASEDEHDAEVAAPSAFDEPADKEGVDEAEELDGFAEVNAGVVEAASQGSRNGHPMAADVEEVESGPAATADEETVGEDTADEDTADEDELIAVAGLPEPQTDEPPSPEASVEREASADVDDEDAADESAEAPVLLGGDPIAEELVDQLAADLDEELREQDLEAAAAEPEPVVSIPRPLAPPPVESERVDGALAGRDAAELRPTARQRQLFGGEDGLIQEAIDVVTGARRASAALLQRKLRIDYQEAIGVLAELAARGVITLDGDATQGRVLD